MKFGQHKLNFTPGLLMPGLIAGVMLGLALILATGI